MDGEKTTNQRIAEWLYYKCYGVHTIRIYPAYDKNPAEAVALLNELRKKGYEPFINKEGPDHWCVTFDRNGEWSEDVIAETFPGAVAAAVLELINQEAKTNQEPEIKQA